jgi:hypothetical protein
MLKQNKMSSSHNDTSSSYEGWSAVHFYQAKECRNVSYLTMDPLCNPNLVTSIRTTTEMLEVSTNGRKIFPNQKATVPNCAEVWYNSNALTNIFSLFKMEKKYHITYDSSKKTIIYGLSKSSNGLYYHKLKYNTNINKDKASVNHTIFPITALVKSFSHVMIAGVNDSINFAGVARNTTNNNDINTGKLVEFWNDEPSKTLLEL